MPDSTTPNKASAGPDSAVAADTASWRKPGIMVPVIIAGVLGTIACWWLMDDEKEVRSPADRLRQALKLIEETEEPADRNRARDIALTLQEEGYRDPEFAGGIEFVLGIVAFREAETDSEEVPGQGYQRATTYLRTARKLALNAGHRPEWSYAMGVSLYQLGFIAEARPRLEESLETFPAGKLRASTLLLNACLETRTPESLQAGLELGRTLLEAGGLTPPQTDRFKLQLARIHLALNEHVEASQILEQVSDDARAELATVVLRGQALMADQKYRPALELLLPVAAVTSGDQTLPREASYLAGLCHEELEQFDNAISVYTETARRYEDSDAAVAARLRAATLLRRKGLEEQALTAYRAALRQVRRPEDFHNQWLSAERFRQTVLTAWNEWVEAGEFENAIELATMMPPLFPQTQAQELIARAHEHRAEAIDDELISATWTERKRRRAEQLEQWQESGRAFAQLAELLRATSRYPDVLRTSAEHYRRGHDFDAALRQWTRFINSDPDKYLPNALVHRGEVLMDLGRLEGSEGALAHFQRVLENYPRSNAAWDAAFVIGLCYLELNQPDAAEKSWREVLRRDDLTPEADVWRKSLFALGRLLFHRAAGLKLDAAAEGVTPKQSAELLDQASGTWQEAGDRLSEFLKRYPGSQDAYEARYLLGRALQAAADQARRNLQSAETGNARSELREVMREQLRQAVTHFRRLQTELLKDRQAGQLDDVGETMLRDVHFEIAHTFYALEEFEKAIVNYNSAVNRYQQEPQSLLAYLQMANCYERLNRPVEARSMLEQARVMLDTLPGDAFLPGSTNMSRTEWQTWINWARRIHTTPGPAGAGI